MIEERVQSKFSPGQRIRVIKRVRFQENVHAVVVEGCFQEQRRVRTESSFAQGRQGRYWVDEILLKKDDGEQSIMMIDQWTRIEPLDDGICRDDSSTGLPTATRAADQTKGASAAPTPDMPTADGTQ